MTSPEAQLRVRLGGYREYAPPADLHAFIDAVWSYARPFDAPPIPGRGHRVVPDASLSVTFSSRRDAAGRIVDARLVIIGSPTTARFFSPEPGVDAVGIRLHPEWARDLIDVDPRDYFDIVDVVRSGLLRPAFDRFARTATSAEAISVLVGEFRRLISSARMERESRLAHEARRWISTSPAMPTLSMDALARNAGVTDRHLRRVVKSVTGLSLKQLHRMRRVTRVMLAADRVSQPQWAQLAFANGFYDQSHMIQEFRNLTGSSPVQLHTERRAQL